MSLKDTQVSELLKILQVEPRSTKDIAEIIGVHYVTAHKWIKELIDRGLVGEMPFQRGKEKMYCKIVGAATEDGTVRVQFRGTLMPIASMAFNDPAQVDPFRYSQSILAALYQKSLKRAGIATWCTSYTDLQLLDQMRRARALLLDELQALEQLLMLDELWEVDKDTHRMMGPLPYPVENIMEHVQPVEDRYMQENTSGG